MEDSCSVPRIRVGESSQGFALGANHDLDWILRKASYAISCTTRSDLVFADTAGMEVLVVDQHQLKLPIPQANQPSGRPCRDSGSPSASNLAPPLSLSTAVSTEEFK